jgi:hypothetical protein
MSRTKYAPSHHHQHKFGMLCFIKFACNQTGYFTLASHRTLAGTQAFLTEVFIVFVSLSRQLLTQYLKLGHDRFPLHSLQFSNHDH